MNLLLIITIIYEFLSIMADDEVCGPAIKVKEVRFVLNTDDKNSFIWFKAAKGNTTINVNLTTQNSGTRERNVTSLEPIMTTDNNFHLIRIFQGKDEIPSKIEAKHLSNFIKKFEANVSITTFQAISNKNVQWTNCSHQETVRDLEKDITSYNTRDLLIYGLALLNIVLVLVIFSESVYIHVLKKRARSGRNKTTHQTTDEDNVYEEWNYDYVRAQQSLAQCSSTHDSINSIYEPFTEQPQQDE